ncbi:MAG TPA: hypothetical protein VNO30_05070 [Kofleriaceae bacterium]|nr:hypothetical protein [Kofleriaceae bacterium]
MKKPVLLALVAFLAFVATGCQLYFGETKDSDDDSYCAADGYYVRGEWVSAQCPGGGNACLSNKDCAAGCFCDEVKGTCDEGGFCSQQDECAPDMECDEARSSCVPVVASCAGAIATSCTNGAPRCPAGSVPLIKDGCYYDRNGDGQFDCQAIDDCNAPPTCQAYQYAADCSAASCTTITRGENCRAQNGATCQDGQPGCVCQTYTFARCE